MFVLAVVELEITLWCNYVQHSTSVAPFALADCSYFPRAAVALVAVVAKCEQSQEAVRAERPRVCSFAALVFKTIPNSVIVLKHHMRHIEVMEYQVLVV